MTLHAPLFVAALILGGGAAAIDGVAGRDDMTAVALAEAIVAGQIPRVFDLRSHAEFETFHIPSATRITIGDLMALDLPRSASIVLYGDESARVAQARAVLRFRGYRHVASLRQGLYEWIARVHEPALAVDATPVEREEFDRLAALSRYFGGRPRLDVPRAELHPSVETALLVAAIRRRGC